MRHRGAMLAAAAVLLAGPAAAAKHEVVMDGVSYAPSSLTVKRGDTVVWVNRDPFPHTVTSGKAFDSREIAAGGTWTHVARTPGSYPYVCTLHPGMKGTLVVE